MNFSNGKCIDAAECKSCGEGQCPTLIAGGKIYGESKFELLKPEA